KLSPVNQFRVRSDLDEAIAAAREATARIPHEHPDRAAVLSNLGSALQVRFERTGTASDLNEAIALTRAALVVAPSDDPSYATILNNLGSALRQARRFEEAITAHNQALSLFRQT